MARPALLLTIALLAIGLGACGTQRTGAGVDTADKRAVVLFQQRCGGCHTLSYAATHGSASTIRTRERNDGPNFNAKKECDVTRVLYAIRNGGFSGAIMPQNIVVGKDAEDVAAFLVKYSGRKAPKNANPCAVRPNATTTPSPKTTPSRTTTTTTP